MNEAGGEFKKAITRLGNWRLVLASRLSEGCVEHEAVEIPIYASMEEYPSFGIFFFDKRLPWTTTPKFYIAN